jgi:hypothetical protein
LDLSGFDDCVVVRPGLFETMRQQFDRRPVAGAQDQKSGCRSAKSTNHPKNIFHRIAPSL